MELHLGHPDYLLHFLGMMASFLVTSGYTSWGRPVKSFFFLRLSLNKIKDYLGSRGETQPFRLTSLLIYI